MLHRIYFIDRRIASGEYPNTRTLAEEYETGTATVSRDIDFMRNMMDAPIEYDALHRGYYYTDKTYRLPAGFSTAEDMLALGVAKNLLSIYQDTPMYHAVRCLIDSITAPMAVDKDSRWFENRIVVPKIATAPVAEETWQAIITALRENRVLRFEYTGAWDSGPKPRRVRPYQLLFDGGVWFLYGHDGGRGAIRMYALPRIKNISVTPRHFTLPRDYDYRQKDTGSSFGLFSGGKKQHFRIAFCDDSMAWVEERIWAADQKITKTASTATIEFTSTQLTKVLDWVLSRGCTARPLEPAELVRRWKWNIAEMGKIVDFA
jgi:predicted DNA-binding transcriptional regulator YafY